MGGWFVVGSICVFSFLGGWFVWFLDFFGVVDVWFLNLLGNHDETGRESHR